MEEFDSKLLEELCSFSAVPGREDIMISFMRDTFKNYTNQVKVDHLGNVIAMFPSSQANQGGPSVMIAAHMDEVGLMVKKIEKNGYLRVDKLGSPNRKTLVGQKVLVEGYKGYIEGVIGVKSLLFTPPEERYTIPDLSKMYVDIGVNTKEEALEIGVNVGSSISYFPNYSLTKHGYIISKSLDDRIGCYILIKLLKKLNKGEIKTKARVSLVGTVQEEFSSKGAIPAAHDIQPDIGIYLDIVPACDTPDLEGKIDVVINEGPVIVIKDFHGRGTLAGLISNPKLVKYLELVAQKSKIPIQFFVESGILTDTAYAQLVGKGIIFCTISVPGRYLHSPVEVSSVRDINKTILFLEKVLSSLDSKVFKSFERG